MKIALDGANLDYGLTSLRDGAEAMEHLSRHAKNGNSGLPDIVLLDLNVPKADGLEILREIRGANRFDRVPVVVLSSSESPRDKAAVLAMPGTAFVTKPLHLDGFLELGRTIKILLDCSQPSDRAKT